MFSLICFIIAIVLFVVAAVGAPKPAAGVHLGWLGAAFLALGLAVTG